MQLNKSGQKEYTKKKQESKSQMVPMYWVGEEKELPKIICLVYHFLLILQNILYTIVYSFLDPDPKLL